MLDRSAAVSRYSGSIPANGLSRFLSSSLLAARRSRFAYYFSRANCEARRDFTTVTRIKST
jgi:hypothetical protein